MKKVTVVEWLVEAILKHDKSFIEFYEAEINQAKEMEKQQIIEAHESGIGVIDYGYAEEYYNETFKQ